LIPSAFTPESIRDKIYKILAYYINHIGITYQQKYEADKDTILQNNEGLVGRVTLLALRGDSMYFEVV